MNPNLISTFLDSRFQPLNVVGQITLSGAVPVPVFDVVVPTNQRYYLTCINVSSDAETVFGLSIGSVLNKILRTNSVNRSLSFDWGSGFVKVNAQASINLNAELDDNTLSGIPVFGILSGFFEVIS